MDVIDTLISAAQSAAASGASLKFLFLIAVGLVAFLAVYLGGLVFQRVNSPVRGRVGRVVGGAQKGSMGKSERVMVRLGRELVPKDAKKRGKTATMLVQAGYRQPNAILVFYGFKLLGIAILAPIATLLLWTWLGGNFIDSLQYGAFAALLGFVAADLILIRIQRRRQDRVRRGLPDALDMLVVCGEAGLGLNASIDRVAREIDVQHPELSAELETVTMEMRAGLDTATAMRGLVERTGLEEMKSLVSTLLQAIRFGVGIAESLRVYAEDLRDKRLQGAEEQAAKLEVKMIFPITLLILPAFMLVAIGPAIIQLTSGLG